MILPVTPVSQIDWETPGARKYSVPFTMDGTWGRVRLPLYVVVGRQSGKTVVAIGGTHGDEYEGPVGYKNLIAEFDPARLVAGRLIDSGTQCSGLPGRSAPILARQHEHESGLSW